MSEDLGAVAVTAGVNALAGLLRSVPWSRIGDVVRRTVTRAGRDAHPDLERALDADGGPEAGGDAPGDREQRLAALLAHLPQEELAEVVRDLEALRRRTEITVNGGNAAINTGSGDQNVTFG